MRQMLKKTHGWLQDAGDWGTSLLLVLLIIDIIFPGSTGIMTNLSTAFATMSVEGRYSIIALLLFLVIHNRRRDKQAPSESNPTP